MKKSDVLTLEFMEQLKEIVYLAGDLIKDTEGELSIKKKEGPANFVTKYDSMVQAFLISKLQKLLPEAIYLGEEDGQSAVDVSKGFAFVIDPIDGTTNFICNFLCSGISVGLAYNGKIIMGVIYNPFRDEMFYAAENMGAFLNKKPLSMVDNALSDGVTIFGSTPYNPELRDCAFDLAKKVSYHTMDLRELGAASICLCYAACGRAVIYASPRLSAWDYAAATILIEEAGGCVKSFDGSDPALRSKVSVVGGSKKGVAEFLQLAADSIQNF